MLRRAGSVSFAAHIGIGVFSTALVASAAITKGPYLQGLGANGVTVKVELSSPAPAVLEVTGPDGKALRFESTESKDFHAIHADKLAPGTSYSYRVTAGGISDGGSFTTADAAARKFSFVVYGDSRSDPAAHFAVAKKIEATPGSFLVNTGDMVAMGSDPAEWRSLFEIEGAILKNRCVFVTVGNHELYEQAPGRDAFLKYFAVEDEGRDRTVLYGSFRWDNTRFFLLNAMDDWTGAERAWLKAELDRADGEAGLEHRIAVLHWAPFSSGPHGNNPALARGRVVEMMRDGKIDLILAGHDHIYERGEGLGVKYLISGGAGAPLYPKKFDIKETQRFESVHHFLEIAIDGPAISEVARLASGGVIEKCAFKSGEAWVCEGSTDPVPTASPEPKTVAPRPVASACGCSSPGESSGSSWWLVASAAIAVAVARKRNACSSG